jgi:arylsulfatase A-like enzyme
MTTMSTSPVNVIFIYADDLGRGMLSCYGQRHFQTLNIDRLAADGMRFTHAYGCSFCAPARASLLTGMHDCHRGGWTYTRGGIYRRVREGRMSLQDVSELIHTISLNPPDDERFLAQLPQQAGYVTAQIGKLEWGFATTDREVRRHGWDYHYGYYDHVDCHGFYPPFLFENGTPVAIPGNTRIDCGKAPERGDTPEQDAARWDRTGRGVYSQDLFDEKILWFLRAHRDRPFFLYHPSQLPHGPIIIPEVHPAVRDNPALTQYEKEYASMVLRLDQTVGLILDELDRLGIADNTMVVFCSDNGHSVYYQQEGRCYDNRAVAGGELFDNIERTFYSDCCGDVFDGNDGMAGLKFSNWEGGVRLPFLVRWPGAVKPASESHRLFAMYDFFATLADMLGLPCPAGKDSVSCLDELRGAGDGRRGAAIFFASKLGPAMVTDDGWKLRQVTVPKRNLYQLFHLPGDYREEKNCVFDHRALVEDFGRQLLFACDGNFLNGTPDAHHVWYPGMNFHGPDCWWDMAP